MHMKMYKNLKNTKSSEVLLIFFLPQLNFSAFKCENILFFNGENI